MRNLLLTIGCSLSSISFVAAQASEMPGLYKSMEPLVKEYQDVKIKNLLVDYKHDKIVVVTTNSSPILTKKQAREAGLIAPAPAVKMFSIEEPIYYMLTNFIDIKNFNRQKENIVSDDGNIYFDEQSQRYKAQSYLIDTAVFYTVDRETFDTTGFCQKRIDFEWQPPEVWFGSITNSFITVDLLKIQKEIGVNSNYTFVSAVVYFIGDNFKSVSPHFLKSNDLSVLQNAIDSCIDGSKIIFDNIILKTENGQLMLASMPVITVGSMFRPLKYSYSYQTGLQIGSMMGSKLECGRFKRQKKIYLSGLAYRTELVSATVYIGGTGFPEVETINLSGPSLAQLYPLIQRCKPGTSISFDNVKVNGPDGMRYFEGKTFLLY